MKTLPISSTCKYCTLKSLLFNSLSDSELNNINKNRVELQYAPGERIIEEGAAIETFLYLKQGLIKLVKTDSNNRERIISIARPLDFVSLLSTFGYRTYPFSITALEDSIVCAIDLPTVKEIIRENGDFALELLQHVSRSSNFVIESNYDIDNKHLRGRIAYILLWFSEKIYHNNIFSLPVSRKEIGELINMTTENVIRILSEFRKDDILHIDGKKIQIINKDILKKLAKSG